VAQPFTATAVPYSASVWLKGAVGGEQLYIMLNVTGGAVRVTLTTTWQRFVVPAITLIAGQVFFQIGADLRDIAQTAILAQTVYVWGAQTEPGAFTTSYIPTAGATATRAVDLPSITPANMAPWFNTSTGSWFAEFVCAWLNGQYQRVIYFPPINAATMIGSDNTAHAFHYDVGPVNASANTITVNAVMKATSSWAAATGRICLNAGGVVTTGGMNNGFAGAASAGIGFMQAATPSSEIMSGYLRRVQYWPRILSDAEMQQVTT
jgi:hypothetical protein